MQKRIFLSKILSLIFVLGMAGCGTTHSSAWSEVGDSLQKIRQSVTQSSNNFTYMNKDLDLKFIESQVNVIEIAQNHLLDNEEEYGRKALLSAQLFYLSELFERSYAEDSLIKMQEVRDEVADILENKSGAGELLSELDEFILAEEYYKKYLAGETSEEKFAEVIEEAESDKLFDLFYRFIDTEVLFGSGGIDFQS